VLRAIFFDFANTLFHLESGAELVAGSGLNLPAASISSIGADVDRSWPGRPGSPVVPDDLRIAEGRRDIDLVSHKRLYVGMMMRIGGLDPAVAERIHARAISPQAWRPYSDTVRTIESLKAKSLRLGVISNIAFDVRRVLDLYGVLELFEVVVLSCEEGTTKPDLAVFRTACERLSLRPDECAMVGDDPTTDGRAEQIGMRFVLVEQERSGRGAPRLGDVPLLLD
jgi:HAD superfamily hydrolase (TIGR01549 family)